MSSAQTTSSGAGQKRSREQFNARWIFILAAIGSAVGLGNIWRFPYVAYENGGGAFIIPYLVALLTAGIPLLFFDYAIGHRFRGSPPLAFKRLGNWTESIGWWQALICFIIGIYYVAILGWSMMYIWFSVKESWGDDPEGFFFGEYLQAVPGDTPAPTLDIAPGVFWPMLIIWVLIVLVLSIDPHRGIGRASAIGIPILILMFLILVGIGLSLPGALQGLDAFFTPNWEALLEPGVWVAAYGQIFFSLSVGFGIMVTYSSYLKRRSNLTGSGLMIGFSNSSFELLAGIGVFSVLGFMAQAQGVQVGEVVSGGIGLAFVAFPAIISQAPFGLGPIIGVLFFGSLLFAGFTSAISIIEVVISSIKDKTGMPRRTVAIIVGVVMGVISLLMFGTTSGIHALDVTDAFVNNIGVVGAALVAVFVVSWVLRRLDNMVTHINAVSSFRLGTTYKILVSVVMPVVLGITMVLYVVETVNEGYGGYPDWYINTFGWGMSLLLIAMAVIISLIPWSKKSALDSEFSENEIDLNAARQLAAERAAAKETGVNK